MGNIITYVQENGHLAFDELGFNEVDSLIFSQLAYLDFSCCMDSPTPFGMTLHDLRNVDFHPDAPSNGVRAEQTQQLFDLMETSRRYRDVGVDHYVSVIDAGREMQFAAVTFRLSPRLHYIAFRGTDATIVGWKEDFNMSYLADVPAQQAAVQYFEDLCGRMRSHYILGGHSKGGNLAVYAAMMAQPKFRQSIALIYDHDGPGFLERVLARPGFQPIKNRIYKTVPESAVVGLLLAEHEKYTVVESRTVGLLQHDPFSWKVEEGRFLAAKDTDFFSKATDRTLSRFLSEQDDATRRIFVDTLFDIIESTGASTFSELTDNWTGNLRAIAAAVRGVDPAVRRMIFEAVKSLLRASGKGVRETLDDQWNQTMESLAAARDEYRQQAQENFANARETLQQATTQAQETIAQTRENLQQATDEFLERLQRLMRPKPDSTDEKQ